MFNKKNDPKTVSEAKVFRVAAFWKGVVNDEIDSILSDNTWNLVDLPPSSHQLVVNGYLGKGIIQADPFKPLPYVWIEGDEGTG